ncbi:MAG: D-2-hydroxyacid dehydrogenase [Clostridiales bacterium]|nr:D-2-hydroxyacid dehydrogenase [Clostridiales bacterium]
MKIVVLDGYTENPGDLSWEPLAALGDLEVHDRTPQEDVAAVLGDAEIAIVNKLDITKDIIDACPNLRYIGVLATGYDCVDYKYAKEKGIPVTNIPVYGTASVSQFAISLLLEICEHVGHHDEAVHAGRWENNPDWCFWEYPLIELDGKTMGIIGFGRIGQQTGRIAKALGMRILANDAHESEAGREIAEYVDLEQLLAQSDVIALHCPLFPETEGIINKNTIAKMKDGVILINNSRGPLVVEQDLADALNSGKVYAAAVDVTSTEPIRGDNPLLTAKNCIITPHISWAPKESRQRIMDTAADNLKAFLEGAPVNVVNL